MSYNAVFNDKDIEALKVSMSDEDIRKRISHVIEKAHPYGEFEVILDIDKLKEVLNKTDTDDEQKRIFIKNYQEVQQDNLVLNYLVKEGFAVNRNDIQIPGKLYRQLNDRGRDLKALGSLDKFNLSVAEATRNKHIQDQRLARMYWINLWIAVGAIVAGLYYANELWKEYLSDYEFSCIRFWIFLAGICTGVIGLLIVQKVLRKR